MSQQETQDESTERRARRVNAEGTAPQTEARPDSESEATSDENAAEEPVRVKRSRGGLIGLPVRLHPTKRERSAERAARLLNELDTKRIVAILGTLLTMTEDTEPSGAADLFALCLDSVNTQSAWLGDVLGGPMTDSERGSLAQLIAERAGREEGRGPWSTLIEIAWTDSEQERS